MSDKQQILLVDDDVAFCGAIAESFEDQGRFVLTSACTIAEAEERRGAFKVAYDAFILDVGLPDGDGRDYCANLRKQGIEIPILMLTGSDAEADMVRGLSAGANDYIAKPFRMAVLMARLRSQLRSFENSIYLKISIGPYTFQPAEKMLRDPSRHRPILLTEKEIGILRLLCRTPGKSVSRQQLLSEVWGYNKAVRTHTLETHVYRLRRKIEADPSKPRLIRASSGGYSIHPMSDVVESAPF